MEDEFDNYGEVVRTPDGNLPIRAGGLSEIQILQARLELLENYVQEMFRDQDRINGGYSGALVAHQRKLDDHTSLLNKINYMGDGG